VRTPEPESLETILRRERRSKNLEGRTQCELCPCADPSTLRRRQTIVCAECAARLDGRNPVEQHHPLGKHISPETIRTPANVHDYLSERQRDWPPILSTANDPVIFVAALLWAIGDFCAFIALHAVECSDYLLRLREGAIRHFGEAWESQLLA
jgi:hypothetical protein